MPNSHGVLPSAFAARIPPRRYGLTIEEALVIGEVVTVADATAQLDRRKRRLLRSWTCPMYSLRLIAAKAGCCRRWWFRCPSCARRCEAVYKVPGDDDVEWACRLCCGGGGLQYAARRHGPRHPTRKVRTPRQVVIAQRSFERDRRLVESLAKTNPWWSARRDALLRGMAAVVENNNREAEQAADWLREQLRRPRRTVPPREIARQLGPDVVDVLRRLNIVNA